MASGLQLPICYTIPMSKLTGYSEATESVPFTYHFPDGKRCDFTGKMRLEKITQLELTIPPEVVKRRLEIDSLTKNPVLQFEPSPPDWRETWIDIAQNILLKQALRILDSQKSLWYEILEELWRALTLNYLMASLYYNWRAEQLLAASWQFHSAAADFIIEQIDLLKNAMPWYLDSSSPGTFPFARWQQILKMLGATYVSHCNFIHRNRPFIQACRAIPRLPSNALTQTNSDILLDCYELYLHRARQIQQNWTAAKRLSYRFIFASRQSTSPSLTISNGVKTAIPTPWGLSRAELSVTAKSRSIKIVISHPESTARQYLKSWSPNKTTEELALLINALGILPD